MEKLTDSLICSDRSCHRAMLCKAASRFIASIDEELKALGHQGEFDPENLTDQDRFYISLRAGKVALTDYRDGLIGSCRNATNRCCEPEVPEIRGDERMLSSLYVAIETNTPMSTVLSRHKPVVNDY